MRLCIIFICFSLVLGCVQKPTQEPATTIREPTTTIKKQQLDDGPPSMGHLPGFCEVVNSGNWKGYCYHAVGEITGNFSLCGGGDDCISDVRYVQAILSSNKSRCEQITYYNNSIETQRCYLALFKYTGENQLCFDVINSEIEADPLRGNCFKQSGLKEKDAEKCSSVTSYVQDCLSDIAIKDKNITICDNLLRDYFRDICRNNYFSYYSSNKTQNEKSAMDSKNNLSTQKESLKQAGYLDFVLDPAKKAICGELMEGRYDVECETAKEIILSQNYSNCYNLSYDYHKWGGGKATCFLILPLAKGDPNLCDGIDKELREYCKNGDMVA
jgi:hypothetical protein